MRTPPQMASRLKIVDQLPIDKAVLRLVQRVPRISVSRNGPILIQEHCQAAILERLSEDAVDDHHSQARSGL